MLKIGGAYILLSAIIVLALGPIWLHQLEYRRYFDPADLLPTEGRCPPNLFAEETNGDYWRRSFVEPVVSDSNASFYATSWADVGEPSFYELSRRNSAETLRSYRITWHPDEQRYGLIATATETEGGSFHFIARKLEMGDGGTKVVSTTERALGATETSRLNALLESHPLGNLDPHACIGPGGVSVTLEAIENGQHHFIARWSPDTGPVYELANEFRSFTGWAQ